MAIREFHLGFERKIGYSFVGLLAGNAVLLLYFLWSAITTRMSMLSIHRGAPREVLSYTLGFFGLYGIFSMVGWVLIGLPFVLLLGATFVSRLHWLFAVIIGGALGPLALLAIFCLLSGGRLTTGSFRNSEMYWIVSVQISTIAFSVYCALVRHVLRSQQIESGAPSGTPRSHPAV